MTEEQAGSTIVNGREIVAIRIFDAPRALVFKMWTDRHHIEQWWGPRGFTTTTKEMAVEPGGIWRFTMHGPDGVDYPNRIEFIEIVEPERLIYRHGSDESDEPVDFHVTVLFEDVDGKTRLTLRSLFKSPEALQDVIDKYGALEGMKQHLARLGEYLSQQNGRKS